MVMAYRPGNRPAPRTQAQREALASTLFQIMQHTVMGNRPNPVPAHLAFDRLPTNERRGWIAVAAAAERMAS